MAARARLLEEGPHDADARRIQFPIEDDPDRFKKARVRKFLLPAHFQMLDRFQPYKAGNRAPTHALGILRDLSNIDKHRVVHAAAVVPEEFRFEFADTSGIVSHGEIEIFHGKALEEHTQVGRIPGVVASNPKPAMDAKGPFTVSIVLDDPGSLLHGEHVTQVLGQLGEVVDTTVKWFASELTP